MRMKRTNMKRGILAAAMAGGFLFAGPCGITGLQLRDFATSTLIRTGVTTLAAVIESSLVEAARAPEATP